jgi:hypothetical protein
MIGGNAETLGLNLFLCDACIESLFESMLDCELGKRVLDKRVASRMGTATRGPILQEVLEEFFSACCDFGPQYAVPAGALYITYAARCAASGQEPLAKNGFGKLLRDRGLSQRRVGHEKTRKWAGIRLRPAEGEYL